MSRLATAARAATRPTCASTTSGSSSPRCGGWARRRRPTSPAMPVHRQHRRRDRPRAAGAAAGPGRRASRTGARGQPATLLSLDRTRRATHRRQDRPPLARRHPGRLLRARCWTHRRHRARLPDARGGAAADPRHRRRAAARHAGARGPTGWPGSGWRCPTTWAPGGASSPSRTPAYPRWNEFDLAGRLGAGDRPARPRPRTTARRPPWPSCSAATAATSTASSTSSSAPRSAAVSCWAATTIAGPTGNAGDIGLMPVGPSRLATAPAPERAATTCC